jgi:hypothetical protein
VASVTAQTLIGNAFIAINVYAVGQSLVSGDSALGLQLLNVLLDEWANENIFVQQYVQQTLNISSSKSSYTIGPNGSPSLTAPRPNNIEVGPGAASCTISATTTAVNVVSSIEWNSIFSLTPGTGTPDTLFYDPQYPLGVLNIAPTPTTTGTIQFNAAYVLSSFAALSTSANLALGAQNAIQNNLALDLLPYYRSSAQPNPRIMADAAEGKDFLRYGSIVSRAMMGRRLITTGRQPAPPSQGEE